MEIAPDIKAADLQRIGVSKPWSHQLLAGGKTPSLSLALRIEKSFGIPASAWPLAPKSDRAA